MNDNMLGVSRDRLHYLAVAGAFATVLVSLWLLVGPVPNALALHNENFCTKVSLAAFGQANDRCSAPNGGWILFSVVETFERAGCESIENNGELLASWTCTGSKSFISTQHSTEVFAHGIIRNNNTVNAGVFSGSQDVCEFKNCEPS